MEGTENASWFLASKEKNFGEENRGKNKLLIMTFGCRSLLFTLCIIVEKIDSKPRHVFVKKVDI